MSLNFVENMQSKINITTLKTCVVIFAINVIISYVIIYYLQQEQLMSVINVLMEQKLPTSQSCPMFFPIIFAFVIALLAYKHMNNNEEYTVDIVNNLKIYYQNIKHLLLNVLPLIVIYMINIGETYDDADSIDVDALTKYFIKKMPIQHEIPSCDELPDNL